MRKMFGEDDAYVYGLTDNDFKEKWLDNGRP